MVDARDFKKFSFVGIKSPSVWGVIALIVISGIAAGLGAKEVFGSRLLLDSYVFIIGFIAVNLLSGFLVDRLVGNFKAKWSYLTVLLNQLALIAIAYIFIFSTRINFLDSLVFWTAMSYTLWMLLLSGLGAVRIGARSFLLSMIQPLSVWALMLSSVSIIAIDLSSPMVLMVGSIAFSTLVILFTEHVFSLVFAGMSGMAELSKVLKGIRGEQVSLDIGHNIDALVQYFKIRAGAEESVVVAPWLHSGPIRSVGGGNLSTQSIKKLNARYGDSYFMHVPSNHEYNPSRDISSRVVQAVEGGNYETLKSSKVARVEKNNITVMGQRLNDVYIISLASARIDDYDISIFSALRDKYRDKKVVFVDSHPNFPMTQCFNVETFTRDAELIEELIDKIIMELSKASLKKARAGSAVRFFEDYSVFALIFEAEETVLYFIADTNGLSENEARMIHDISGRLGIDHALFFTTDTHSLTVKALINRPDTPKDVIESIIREAKEGLADAELSYGEKLMKNVRILGKSYYELLTVVKIMSRVTPVLFFLFFLFLAVMLWIF